MSKMKDLQITLDDARELVEKFAEEHTDVTVEFSKCKANPLFFTVRIRDKYKHFGWGHMFDTADLCANGLSCLENKLNEFHEFILENRKELES